MCAVCLVAQLCLTFCNPMDYSPPYSSCQSMGILQAKLLEWVAFGVGYHALLQGIFPTQGSNPGLPHCRQTLYQLSYREALWISLVGYKFVAYSFITLSEILSFQIVSFYLYKKNDMHANFQEKIKSHWATSDKIW